MTARLHFIVEGQTEETFVNQVLVPHLGSLSVGGDARCVETSRKHGIKYRGGLTNYAKAKNDIVRWMKQDQHADAFFATMFDLYALPKEFPGYADAQGLNHPYTRVAALEDGLHRDIMALFEEQNINHHHFIPYIQLHEFETLLLADPQKLDWEYLEHDDAIRNLIRMASTFESPELIDEGNETAPSKRIIREIPEYEEMKASAGPIVAGKIGLVTLREKCRHFGEWLRKLENLGVDI